MANCPGVDLAQVETGFLLQTAIWLVTDLIEEAVVESPDMTASPVGTYPLLPSHEAKSRYTSGVYGEGTRLASTRVEHAVLYRGTTGLGDPPVLVVVGMVAPGYLQSGPDHVVLCIRKLADLKDGDSTTLLHYIDFWESLPCEFGGGGKLVAFVRRAEITPETMLGLNVQAAAEAAALA